ncbi:PSD1 and planctomycete cytochrome C domain-containing protein [Crateriforma conspicua]|uniref:PSD1 and planctomycete cytochrome C domain-containing protein n=1 Tax=Crateriforma conspicua TaxID=2527996 RepID=UPI00118B1BAE|nr:PSD1 and planctomycete cytochrome C domain-containing protein [Crateriforma conspicua]QDV64224.1 Planctomycete cytochrome C [Crateriforma conspicua]
MPLPALVGAATRLRIVGLVAVPLLISGFDGDPLSASDSSVDFATDIRPLLSEHCFQCHGPDPESRQADLRLDIGDDAAWVLDTDAPDDSELIARVTSDDPDLVMPPPESGGPLDPEEVDRLRRWMADGASFENHWAFTAPVQHPVPEVDDPGWVKNPIDHFVLSKIESAGRKPSPVADPATLLRRLSLDLIGLPPTPEQIAEFTSQYERSGNADAAYHRWVDRLLDSPAYGERWSRVWLDAARYADSDGYEKDKPRQVWFYRDWVVDSLNQDRPYDDFIIRQIAGDLLPGATQADHVATGFLRNSMVNEEGGADPEQFRMEAMFDRLDAIGKSVLGLTIQCAQCHSHKYDPISHEEYYGLMAFINNTDDAFHVVYTPDEIQQRRRVVRQVEDLYAEIRMATPTWQRDHRSWQKQLKKEGQPNWVTPTLEFLDSTIGGQKFLPQDDGSYLCQGYAPTNFKPKMTARYDGTRLSGIRIQMLTDPNLPREGPGRSVEGTWGLSELTAEVAFSGSPDKVIPVKFAGAWADRPTPKADLGPRYDNRKDTKRIIGSVDFAIDGDLTTAWSNDLGFPLANRSQTAWFRLAEPIEVPDGQHAIIHVYLAQRHGGWNSDDNQTFNVGRFKLSFTGDSVQSRSPLSPDVQSVLDLPPKRRSDQQNERLFRSWVRRETKFGSWQQEIDAAWARHPAGTTQLTLSERQGQRLTSLLDRGDFLSPVAPVQPHVPAFLHAMQPSDEPPRLQFARWLVDRDSPTVPRSIVNRIWQAYFGVGLVETSDDLGSQSSPPSHPQLLDWLAVDLMDNGWSLKHLHRRIVTSATYRQSSVVSDDLLAEDPYNRLLARGARFRAPAETVRDITLAAAGLLDRRVGGPSVTPPAPEFLFLPPVSYGPKVWDDAVGGDRYRRGLYTFRFRSVPYPMLEAFDAVPGNTSCVRRSRSNTPLQALTSLNEPMAFECAAAMAADVLLRCDDEPSAVDLAFLRCTGRRPEPTERHVLLSFLNRQRERINDGQVDTAPLLAAIPKAFTGVPVDDADLAAWVLTCRVMLNLDETISRQ